MNQQEKLELILLHRLWKSSALTGTEYSRYCELLEKRNESEKKGMNPN